MGTRKESVPFAACHREQLNNSAYGCICRWRMRPVKVTEQETESDREREDGK